MVMRPVLMLFVAAALVASRASGLEYRVGDKVEQEIRTPVRLVVVDVEATEKLKEREAQRVHAIYRFFPNAVNEVEAAFHSTFERTRSNFLDAVETRFSKRRLDSSEAGSNDFQRFVTQFQRQNILFPVPQRLGRMWALGEQDQEFELELISRLRTRMQGYVRPDTAPKDIWVGSTIRLVSLADNEEATATLVAERGFNVAKTNFVAAQRAKTDLLNSFPAEERTIARYLASFIKPNCTIEAELTRTLREQRTAGLSIADRYEAGQVIARRGEVITSKIKAALEELEEKNALAHVKETSVASVTEPNRKVPTWGWAAGAAGLLVLVALWGKSRRKAPSTLLPALIPAGTAGHEPHAISGSEEAWRSRALQAEQQAAKARAVVRQGLMTQLAQWMSNKMTQRLVAQRAELMNAHQTAAIEVAELEARLEKVQAPLQERLAAYQSRIAELEKELLAKGEENRELIKAKIQIIRKQVEIERDKRRLEFN